MCLVGKCWRDLPIQPGSEASRGRRAGELDPFQAHYQQGSWVGVGPAGRSVKRAVFPARSRKTAVC